MSCSHQNTVESYPEQENVCLDCGLVLDNILLDGMIVDELHYGDLQTFLENVTHNAHIFSGIIQPVMFLFMNISKDPRVKNFRKHELLCYCLFEELLRHNTGRSVRELAFFCEVDSGKIWKIQSILNNGMELSAEHLVVRICDELNVPFSFHASICNILNELDIMSSSKPETKLAAALLIHCERKDFPLKKNNVCNACGVKWTSVRTLRNKYLQKYLFFIYFLARHFAH